MDLYNYWLMEKVAEEKKQEGFVKNNKGKLIAGALAGTTVGAGVGIVGKDVADSLISNEQDWLFGELRNRRREHRKTNRDLEGFTDFFQGAKKDFKGYIEGEPFDAAKKWSKFYKDRISQLKNEATGEELEKGLKELKKDARISIRKSINNYKDWKKDEPIFFKSVRSNLSKLKEQLESDARAVTGASDELDKFKNLNFFKKFKASGGLRGFGKELMKQRKPLTKKYLEQIKRFLF